MQKIAQSIILAYWKGKPMQIWYEVVVKKYEHKTVSFFGMTRQQEKGPRPTSYKRELYHQQTRWFKDLNKAKLYIDEIGGKLTEDTVRDGEVKYRRVLSTKEKLNEKK